MICLGEVKVLELVESGHVQRNQGKYRTLSLRKADFRRSREKQICLGKGFEGKDDS